VQQSITVELLANLKTAESARHFPLSLLARADEVVE
jgi:hypothetical protein